MSGAELAVGLSVLAVVCALMLVRALVVELEEARGGVVRARASQAGADRRAEQARKHQAGADRRAYKLWRELERVTEELKRTERELLKLRLRGQRRRLDHGLGPSESNAVYQARMRACEAWYRVHGPWSGVCSPAQQAAVPLALHAAADRPTVADRRLRAW